jgi:hypothetical protein
LSIINNTLTPTIANTLSIRDNVGDIANDGTDEKHTPDDVPCYTTSLEGAIHNSTTNKTAVNIKN